MCKIKIQSIFEKRNFKKYLGTLRGMGVGGELRNMNG